MTEVKNKNFALEEEDADQNLEEIIEDKIAEEDIKPTRKLDYSLESPQERNDDLAFL